MGSGRTNQPKNQQEPNNQPMPLSGSKKVKNHNHTGQKNNQGHDL